FYSLRIRVDSAMIFPIFALRPSKFNTAGPLFSDALAQRSLGAADLNVVGSDNASAQSSIPAGETKHRPDLDASHHCSDRFLYPDHGHAEQMPVLRVLQRFIRKCTLSGIPALFNFLCTVIKEFFLINDPAASCGVFGCTPKGSCCNQG
ncbi:MAG: hypothetical protein KDJ22_17310, partial [Candidatus Competibacteraceae bacterium]|nr:hypothetical protein [Candidatus Competibacteraceae bacterium]